MRLANHSIGRQQYAVEQYGANYSRRHHSGNGSGDDYWTGDGCGIDAFKAHCANGEEEIGGSFYGYGESPGEGSPDGRETGHNKHDDPRGGGYVSYAL